MSKLDKDYKLTNDSIFNNDCGIVMSGGGTIVFSQNKGGKLIFHYTEYKNLVVSKKKFQDPEWNMPVIENLYEIEVSPDKLDDEIKRAFQHERIQKLKRINENNK